MHTERHTVPITVNASGAGTAYTPPITGALVSIQYEKDDYAVGVDFAITSEATGRNIWTQANVDASVTKVLRQISYSTAGVVSRYAAAGAIVNVPIVLANERIKIAVTNGGVSTSGTFHVEVMT